MCSRIETECPKCGERRTVSRKPKRGQLCRPCRSTVMWARRLDADKHPIRDRERRRKWANRYKCMVARCMDPDAVNFARYGGSGVYVCQSWLDDPLTFFRYVTSLDGFGDDSLQMDRIDNSVGYEKGNLRLVTPRQNSRNRSSNRPVEFEGVSYGTTKEFAEAVMPEWGYVRVWKNLARHPTEDVASRYRSLHG